MYVCMRTMKGIPDVSDCLHDINFTEQTLGQPIQGGDMAFTPCYQ